MSGSCCGSSTKSEPANVALLPAAQQATEVVVEQSPAKSSKGECCNDKPAKSEKRGCCC